MRAFSPNLVMVGADVRYPTLYGFCFVPAIFPGISART